jgi:dynein assembly factor 6, axonemal
MVDANLNIFKLQELLETNKSESSSDEDEIESTKKAKNSVLTPGHIGPKKSTKNQQNESVYATKKAKNSKDIWDVDEVNDGLVYDTLDDPRIQPDYDITYQQAVLTEDIYLNTSMKTPATSSCEAMIVKIKLPGEQLKDIDANVNGNNYLDCRSNKYRLGIYLPHKVDETSCQAKWLSNQETLEIKLKLKREYDFVNF